MKKLPGLIIFIVVSTTALSQNEVLDGYIREGLKSNLALQQKKLDYQKSLYALKEAKGLFFPDISLNSRITAADGGRIISFPVGDMLNPVYSTLNAFHGTNFPLIDNQEFSFYRKFETESKVSVLQPIFSPDIIYNVKAKKEQTSLAHTDVNRYKRELIREIKTAYYEYQKAYYLNQIVDTTYSLVKENLRVSKSLVDNDLATVDVIYRSEAEISRIEVEKARVKNLIEVSKSYFNFLLNKPFNAEIEIILEETHLPLQSLDEASDKAVLNREEIQLLKNYITLNDIQLKYQQGKNMPSLYGAVDYGFQGEEFSFTQDDDFVLASLVLKWNIFHGMTNRNSRMQSRIESEKLEGSLSEAENSIKMQVINCYYGTLSAYEAINSARKQYESSGKAFRIVERKYREGQSNLLEYIDARTNFTTSYSSYIIAKNDYFIQLADLEFAMADLEIANY